MGCQRHAAYDSALMLSSATMALGLSAQPPSHPRTVSQPPSHPRTVSHPTILTRQLPSTFEPRPLSPATQVPDIAMPKELSVGSSFGAASMLFVYVASALLPLSLIHI